jgi:hypothetical protein
MLESLSTTSHEAAVSKRVLGTSLVVLLLAAISGCAAFQSLAVPASMRGMSPADEAFHGVHDALFATFVPLDSLPIDAETRAPENTVSTDSRPPIETLSSAFCSNAMTMAFAHSRFDFACCTSSAPTHRRSAQPSQASRRDRSCTRALRSS